MQHSAVQLETDCIRSMTLLHVNETEHGTEVYLLVIHKYVNHPHEYNMADMMKTVIHFLSGS